MGPVQGHDSQFMNQESVAHLHTSAAIHQKQASHINEIVSVIVSESVRQDSPISFCKCHHIMCPQNKMSKIVEIEQITG